MYGSEATHCKIRFESIIHLNHSSVEASSLQFVETKQCDGTDEQRAGYRIGIGSNIRRCLIFLDGQVFEGFLRSRKGSPLWV